MASRKAGEVESFIRRPDPATPVVLVYGPNAGLVFERAQALARAFVPDPEDPFQLIRLDGDEIAGDAGRLADEAGTIGLFGGRRSIWVRAGSRNLAPAVEPLLSSPPDDALIVVEAGDLAKGNPIRVMVEASRRGMALPCYADEARDVGQLADTILGEAGLRLERDAREALVGLLGADRLLSRREVEKLALYAAGERSVSVDMVEAVIADAAAVMMDAVVDAAFSGDTPALHLGLARVFGEGTDPNAVLLAALRHAITLHRIRLAVDRGDRLESHTGRIHFKRKAAVERQVRTWRTDMLETAITTLRDSQLQLRRNAAIGETLMARTLLTLATRVGRG